MGAQTHAERGVHVWEATAGDASTLMSSSSLGVACGFHFLCYVFLIFNLISHYYFDQEKFLKVHKLFCSVSHLTENLFLNHISRSHVLGPEPSTHCVLSQCLFFLDPPGTSLSLERACSAFPTSLRKALSSEHACICSCPRLAVLALGPTTVETCPRVVHSPCIEYVPFA